MPVPLDALKSGLGMIMPDNEIGTAGEHGQERVLTANLPDTALQGPTSKDDSEIRKRPGATLEALDAATPTTATTERPPLERKARSAAEEALRRITVRADASAAQPKALVTARTSSLPPSADESSVPPPVTAATSSAPAPAATAPVVQAQSAQANAAATGVRPFKMVCLDCGEEEAHIRHAQHLHDAAIVTYGGSSTDAQPATSQRKMRREAST